MLLIFFSDVFHVKLKYKIDVDSDVDIYCAADSPPAANRMHGKSSRRSRLSA